jgi:hypothetical protein
MFPGSSFAFQARTLDNENFPIIIIISGIHAKNTQNSDMAHLVTPVTISRYRVHFDPPNNNKGCQHCRSELQYACGARVYFAVVPITHIAPVKMMVEQITLTRWTNSGEPILNIPGQPQRKEASDCSSEAQRDIILSVCFSGIKLMRFLFLSEI